MFFISAYFSFRAGLSFLGARPLSPFGGHKYEVGVFSGSVGPRLNLAQCLLLALLFLLFEPNAKQESRQHLIAHRSLRFLRSLFFTS